MDIRKIILCIIVAFSSILLFNAWMRDYPPVSKQLSKSVSIAPQSVGRDGKYTTYIPPAFTSGKVKKTTEIEMVTARNNKTSTKRFISVRTDVLKVIIDTQGGNIISAKLLKYPISLEEKDTPVQILNANSNKLYVAQSGLTNISTKQEASSIQFSSIEKNYILRDRENKITVQLISHTSNGLKIVKAYTFHRDDYAIQLHYRVKNETTKLWQGNLFVQLTRRQPLAEHRHFYIRTYNGPAISSPQIPYEKITYKSLDKKNIDRMSTGGWIAMQQHYFLTAWIPENSQLNYHYYSRVIQTQSRGKNIYVIGFVNPVMNIAPGETASSYATVYIGPELAKRLKTLAPDLERTIDYGWLWPVSMILFWIMSAVHKIVRNCGWSIVITTILIKIIFYWFSARSFRSMARMRELQPQMQVLKERYGDDRNALSRATMELYRRERINPLGGCLPMLIQIPVFIAFYYVIIESVELRQAPFVLWINDLSVKDPYYILPVLMGLSMLAQQILSPTSPDPVQQKMMWILPTIFTVFFINFPAGLVLYWLTNNVVQTLQQWYVNKTYEIHKVKLKARRAKKP